MVGIKNNSKIYVGKNKCQECLDGACKTSIYVREKKEAAAVGAQSGRDMSASETGGMCAHYCRCPAVIPEDSVARAWLLKLPSCNSLSYSTPTARDDLDSVSQFLALSLPQTEARSKSP